MPPASTTQDSMALRRAEEWLRTVVTNCPVILFALDRQGIITLSQGKGLEGLGLHPGEADGKSVFDAFPEWTEAHDAIRRALAGEALDVVLQAAGHCFETRYAPLRDERGQVIGVTGVATDITERRRAEEERTLLAEATPQLYASLDPGTTLERLARTLVPRLADWCVVYSQEGQSVRRAAVVHAEAAEEQALEAMRASAPHEEYADPAVMEVLRTGRPILAQHVTHRLVREHTRDTTERRAAERAGVRSAMVVPLVCRDRVLGAMTVVTGRSGRHLGPAEQALIGELARRAAVAIDNARLHRAAQEAIQGLQEFIQIASHELRGPLNVLLLLVQSLLQAGRQPGAALQPEGLYHALAAVERQGGHLGRLIRELLDLAQATSGQLDLRRQECDLAALTAELVARYRDQHDGAPVSLRSQGPVTGMWDPLRIEQVIANLLSNAIKYGAGEPVEITVTGDEQTARFEIRDGGPGIRPEDQERIFDRFVRATGEQRERSMGLGLYIVRKILDALGGTIRVRSEPGKGAAFLVDLPRNRPVPSR